MEADRPKLLVLASTYPRWKDDSEPGFVHELTRRLAHWFDVTVIAPHAQGARREEVLEGVRIKRFRYAPEQLQRLSYGGGILANLRHRRWTWLLLGPFLLGLLLATLRELRKSDRTLIHAHWLLPQGLFAVTARRLASSSAPLLCTSHGGDLFALQGALGRKLKQHVLMHSQAVTVVSSAMLQPVSELTSGAHMAHVVPMGVDLQVRFTPGINDSRRPDTVLFVGRLVEKKGVAVLLQAFSRVVDAFPASRLSIIGDGPERNALLKLARTLEIEQNVEFLGAVPQAKLPAHLRAATVFAMPSIIATSGDQEGLGLTQVEAMGCGCPVIASDLPGIRDVVTHGESGLLTSPGDPAALADAIVTLLRDPHLRAQFSTNARKLVLGRFDWEAIADRYRMILLDLSASSANSANNAA